MPRAAPHTDIAAENQQRTFANQQLLINHKQHISCNSTDHAYHSKRVRVVNGTWVNAVKGTLGYVWYRESGFELVPP